jgi:hypothetical protein
LSAAYPFLASDSALRQFVRQWEERVLPKAEWTHAAHVAVCAFYTAEFGPPEALRRMRAGIPLYNLAVGTLNTGDSGYHETLTCFWAQVIGDFITSGQFLTAFDAVGTTLIRFGHERRLHTSFHSFDVVADRRARREWIPPDRL